MAIDKFKWPRQLNDDEPEEPKKKEVHAWDRPDFFKFKWPWEGFKGPVQSARDFNQRQRVKSVPSSDPFTASRPTQRYLRAVGAEAPASRPAYTDLRGLDQGSLRNISAHEYRLTPWQQEQAAGAYGARLPKNEVTLHGDASPTAKMTSEAWSALNPQQQNAVRFNKMLIDATEADRQAAVASKEQDPEYQARVAEMFGTQGGSEVYAPNTLNLLEKMELGGLRGQDLDEYLSLDRAYDMEEIAALQPWEMTPGETPYQSFGQARSLEAQGVLDMRQVDLAGGLIEKALADTSIRGWSEEARISQYLGNSPPPPEQIPFGWLPQGMTRATDEEQLKEDTFKGLYDYLSSDSAENLDQLWAIGDQYKFTDADYDEIFDYFYLMSLEDDRTGVPAGYRTGQQTREFIGIGG